MIFVKDGFTNQFTVRVGDGRVLLKDALYRLATLVKWKQKGLRLLFLPPYCPHLNLIEILWRQVKYCRLWPEAYQTVETLCRSVADILAQVGTKYRISFA